MKPSLLILVSVLGLVLLPASATAAAQPNTVILLNQTDTFFGNVVCSPSGASGTITITYNAVVVTNSLPTGASVFHLTQGGGDEVASTSEGVFTAHFTLVRGSVSGSATTTTDTFEIHGTAPDGTTFSGHFNTETVQAPDGSFHLAFNSHCF